MRNIFLLCITFFISTNTIIGQWKIMNEGMNFKLRICDFVSNDIGWMGGDSALLQTKDGGKNWTVVNNSMNFYMIDFINGSIGWTFSIEGDILKTIDGGKNWTLQETPDTCFGQDICVVTEEIVYITCHEKIYKTTNGGLSWEDVTPDIGERFDFVAFNNPDTGIAADHIFGYFYRTFNGGETWDRINAEGYGNIFDVGFVNDTTGYFIISSSSHENFYICKTSDMFGSWSVIAENNRLIHACNFVNNEVIISVMEDSTGNYIWKSIDGGHTWTKNSTNPLPFFNSYQLYFGTENTGHVIGIGTSLRNSWVDIVGSLILTTTDQGNSWSYINLSHPFNDVFFIDSNNGFIVGGEFTLHFSYGSVFKTQDAGNTWNFVHGTQLGMPTNVVFKNNTVGFITCYWDQTYRTIDGGNSWNKYSITGDNIEDFSDIFFVNEQIGYAIDGCYIYGTTDGSETWVKLYYNNSDNTYFNSLFFIDENKGWVLGTGGCIYRSTDRVSWEKVNNDVDLPLNKAFFSDNTTGFVTGGYIHEEGIRSVFLKSSDGGGSWIELEIEDYLIHDLYFDNNQHGWLVGEDSAAYGVLLETYDGGDNWIVQFDSLSAPLRAIYFRDGYGWAVGGNGLILKYDTTNTGIDDPKSITQSSIGILQNYPNPFSKSTKIKYQLSINSDVELNVYDLTGRKISTLVNEKQQTGTYTVEWNALGMKPGIYLYELKTRQGQNVKKMILIHN